MQADEEKGQEEGPGERQRGRWRWEEGAGSPAAREGQEVEEKQLELVGLPGLQV